MKFYEWLHEYGQDPHVNVDVDTEYYMIKAWNAALDQVLKLHSLDYWLDQPNKKAVNELMQSEEVF